jgi:co-chaperonin GroES (HSP10)
MKNTEPKIRALSDYVLMSHDRKQDSRKGIILSDVSRTKPATMVVEAVGESVKSVRKGSRVLIDPFLPREIKVESKHYYILREKDIFAVIE